MKKIEYIEEKGQTYMDGVLEIRYAEMVEPKHFFNNNLGLIMLHDKDDLIKIPSRNVYFHETVRYSFQYFRN